MSSFRPALTYTAVLGFFGIFPISQINQKPQSFLWSPAAYRRNDKRGRSINYRCSSDFQYPRGPECRQWDKNHIQDLVTYFKNGAPGEIGRQLRCLVAASRLRLSADGVGLGANATLRVAELELLGSKNKMAPSKGAILFLRARRDSNSRPPGS